MGRSLLYTVVEVNVKQEFIKLVFSLSVALKHVFFELPDVQIEIKSGNPLSSLSSILYAKYLAAMRRLGEEHLTINDIVTVF